MTQTITETITDPAAIAALYQSPTDMPDCPDFCDGTCVEWDDGYGGTHHTSGFTTLYLTAEVGDGGKPIEWDISTSRTDEDYQAGACDVNLLPGEGCGGVTMTAAEARQMAALLLNAADMADPLPAGVMIVPASAVRVGDDVDTPDGWQTINGLLMFADTDHVAVFTAEKNDEDSDGWQHCMTDLLRVRRSVHGSCAIAFVEPIPGGAR